MEHLLATKFYVPPIRVKHVPRERLTERLTTNLQRKLTLISAPAGFGKTTLVSEWIALLQAQTTIQHQNKTKLAWLSLDESDNDLIRFLTYLVGALKRIDTPNPSLGDGVLNMLQSPQLPPLQSIMTLLINDLVEIECKVILVLDDYHVIDTSQIDDALLFFIDHLPPEIHLIIATRDDPQLPLARLRARGQLTELRATDLRFTPAEVNYFFRKVVGFDLSQEDILTLEQTTEGWIAGLQLAAISMQGHEDLTSLIRSFSGSNRHILDYLIEEVLERQSKAVQTFMLQTSILHQMSGSLCDALTGQNDGQATLEALERANLFIIPLDHDRIWYRYHHLFADLLRQRIGQNQQHDIVNLHRHAAEWYMQHGMPDEAVNHALQSGDYDWTATLIESFVDEVWYRDEHAKLHQWLSRLPAEAMANKPNLHIMFAWSSIAIGKLDEAEESVQKVENTVEKLINSGENAYSPDMIMTLQGRIAMTHAYLMLLRGDFKNTITLSRKALELLPPEDSAWRSTASIALADCYALSGDFKAAYPARLASVEETKAVGKLYPLLLANLKLAAAMRQGGHLHRLIEICQQNIQLATNNGLSQTITVGSLMAIMGEAMAELNQMDDAVYHATRGVELAENHGDIALLGWSYICLVRVLFSIGRFADAQEIIERLEKANQQFDIPPWIASPISAWQVRLYLAQGELDTASAWAETSQLETHQAPHYIREKEGLVLARVLMAQERLDEAISFLGHIHDAAESNGRAAHLIETLILIALALAAKDEENQAITTLERALSLAKPKGFFLSFVDEGPPMARLLYEAIERQIMPEYAQQLLAAFPDFETEQPTTTDESEWLEPLSERELEVLHLIAQGLSNADIATQLYLSQHTVKVHARNIYDKLGVHKRTQAVARARGLGILSSD